MNTSQVANRYEIVNMAQMINSIIKKILLFLKLGMHSNSIKQMPVHVIADEAT